jgi:hypothetical protein
MQRSEPIPPKAKKQNSDANLDGKFYHKTFCVEKGDAE